MHCSPHSVPVQQCAYGEDIANGMITDNQTDSGEQVQSLTCDPGYQAVGDVTKRECNHTTGNWNARFSCEGQLINAIETDYKETKHNLKVLRIVYTMCSNVRTCVGMYD